MEKTKEITIVIAVYNMADTVERAILSVLNQTYDKAELIVMDGGSTDGTVDIIKKYSDRLTYWISAPDKGPSDAIAKALKHANGRYIGFLGADDWYESYSLKAASTVIEKGEADICYGNMAVHNGECIEVKDLREFDPGKLFSNGTQWLGAVCAFVKKELLEDNYSKRNDVLLTDFLFFLRLYASGKKFVHIGEERPITNFSIGGRTTTLSYSVKKDSIKVRRIIIDEYPEIFEKNKDVIIVLRTYFAMDVEPFYRLLLDKADYQEGIGREIGEDERIILFGAGYMGRECASMLRFIGRKVECFVDNNSDIKGVEIDGIKVFGADHLKKVGNHLIVITPSPLYQEELEKQLIDIGADKKNKITKYSDYAMILYEKFGEDILDDACEKGLIY